MASEQLCLDDPDLLNDRKTLLEKSRALVHEQGYSYVKGKSRSKRFVSGEASATPKRPKLSEDLRCSRMDEISDRIKDITDQILYKEKRREQASNSHNYKSCDMLTEEMSQLKSERRQLECELTLLKKKQKRAKGMKDKRRSSVACSPDTFFRPVPTQQSLTPCGSSGSIDSSRSSTPFSSTDDHDTVIISSDNDEERSLKPVSPKASDQHFPESLLSQC